MTTPPRQGARIDETLVPGIGEAENQFISDVIGNKGDASVTTADSVSSIVSYIKGLLSLIGGAPLDEVAIALGPFGNTEVSDVDSAVRYAVYLYSLGTGTILTNVQTTQGTFTVTRIRAGVPTVLVASTPSTEASGVISAVVDFTTGPADWVEDDVGFIEFSGIAVTIGGTTTNFPVLRRSFRVVGTGIESSLATIDALHDVPAPDAVTNAQMRDVIGNKADSPNVDVVSTSSLMAYLKGLTNVSALATGTFTTSSATVPADTGRTEADGYWDGSWLIPLTGAVAFQPRQIVAFANTGGVFTLDSEQPFTAAPGLVEYVIVGAGSNIVPSADSTANQTEAHAVGNKADAAQTTVGTTRSIIAYVKGLLGFHAVPSVDSTDNVQMRDVIGNKGDTRSTTLAADKSLMAYIKGVTNLSVLATGTFTTSSITVPADTGRAEADNYWDGSWLIPLVGAVTLQPREIVAFANTGGVFTLDPDNPFTAAPGLVEYVIVGAAGNLVPAADSVSNAVVAHIVGNKADAAVNVVGVVASIVGYVKGILGFHTVPAADAVTNAQMRDVLGNKEDARTTVVGTTASVMAYLKGITNLSVLATGTFTADSATVPADTGRTEVDGFWDGKWLIPLVGAVALQPAEIISFANTGGVFTLDSEHPFTGLPGLVEYVIVGASGNLVPSVDSAANQTDSHVIGNKTDAAVTTVSVVASIVGYIKGILGFHTVPSVDSADNSQMRDVIGNKGDTRSTTLASDKSLMAYLKGITNLSVLATGTFTTSSATVPADTGRAEADNYWDGSFLIPLVGAVALQPRLIASFANTGGVFTLDSEHPFTAAPGLVEYVIVGASEGLAPAVDSAANQTASHVTGNKADAAVTTVGVVASVIAYIKGILDQIGAPAGASVSADILEIKNLVDSTEIVGPFTLLDNTTEQTIEEDIALTTRRHVSIEFDLSALTQDGTIRVYRKVDGTNFQLFSVSAFVAAGSEKVFDALFTTNQHWQLTYQATITEGATRSIPFNTITEVIE